MSSNKSPPRVTAGSRTEGESGRARSPSSKGTTFGSISPARSGAPVKTDRVKKNAKGGVLVTPEEIQMAFQLLDVEKSGQLTVQNLKRRLGVLFPELSVKDYRFLMNNKKEMSMDELKDLLMDNEITNFDPVAEAYRVFDQNGEGALSGDKLRQAFMAYGMGELADEELDILIRTADVDGDGAISVEDFRSMLEPVLAANTRKTSIAMLNTNNNNDGHYGGNEGPTNNSKVTFS